MVSFSLFKMRRYHFNGQSTPSREEWLLTQLLPESPSVWNLCCLTLLLGHDSPVFTTAVTSRNMNVATIFTYSFYLRLLSETLMKLLSLAPQLLARIACLQRVNNFVVKEFWHNFRCFLSRCIQAVIAATQLRFRFCVTLTKALDCGIILPAGI